LVSGTILYTTKKERRQQAAKNQNVTPGPTAPRRIGVSWPTMVSAIHITMMLMANARPLIFVGNISEAITNFNGPMENAKQARNKMMLINSAMLLLPSL